MLSSWDFYGVKVYIYATNYEGNYISPNFIHKTS